MSSETGLQPEMALVDRQNQDLPAATEKSDDLFGEDPPEKPTELNAAAPEPDLSNNVPPTTSDSVAVDPQPTSGAAPVTDNSSGIEGVAKFIPSDANLNQPTVSPSEPLIDGEARIDEDTHMTGAPSLDTESSAPPPPAQEQQATEGSKPVGADSAVSTSPTTDQPTATAGLNGDSDDSKPVNDTNSADDQVPASTDLAPTDLAPKDLSNGTMTNSNPIPEATTVDEPAATKSEPLNKDVTAPAIATPVDHEMSDAPSSGTVRAREDEDDASGEPSAKRTKTVDDKDHTVEAEFEKPTDAPANNTASTSAPAPAPAQSANGNVAHPRSAPNISSAPINKPQKTFLIEKMKNTKKVKSAFWFTKPVDYMALNIPHYPTIIKQPMDLTTMEQKLKNDHYSSVNDLVADFELMVNNCFTFNGINHTASIAAQTLRAYFMKQMEMCPAGGDIPGVAKAVPKAKKPSPKPQPRRESTKPGASAKSPTSGETFALLPDGTPMIRRDSTTGRPKRAVIPPAPRDLPYASSKPKRKEAQTGLKFCEHILDEFRKPKNDRFAAPFRVPVDPVALNIPTYFNIIKHPMDVSTITQKLKGGQYSSAQEFKADFDLMFNNCFKFNGPENPVHQMGKEFAAEFEREWSRRDVWVKKHAPHSQRASPASDASDGGDDSDDGGDDDDEHDSNEATIALLREQLLNMQNMVASIASAKQPAQKANKKKKSGGGGGSNSKSSKKAGAASNSRPTIKTAAKPKKQRLVTYDEKQEISNATEHMTSDQVEKLTNIITENVAKYKDMAGDDVELEIDDLPNEVQHKLLKYVRSIFPKNEPVEDANAIDDDYEPERVPTGRSGGAAKKKHKPMKKHEQESRIAQLKEQMAAMSGSVAGMSSNSAAPAQSRPDSSDDDDSESSEEE